jgi:alkanesulfonate monooxygenase SsuD/methylene tetrahydromethanopterin reductase-like flavin-dependent oxidoreductase (luciferase family)
MKFGVFSLIQWPEDRTRPEVHRDELEQLSVAETQGYDSAWLAEHPFSRHGIAPSIHLTAANLAARTSRIRIGTGITLLPILHPLRLAEEVAMLDILSGGRFVWGVGRGHPGHEFEGFGVDISRSHAIFQEQLEIVRRALSGEPFAWEGEYFSFPELQCLPTPVQQPHPPIQVAAPSPATMEWAARQHLPVSTDPFSPLHRIEKNLAVYHAAAREAGFDAKDAELPVLRQVYVGETAARAREEAAPALLGYYRALARVGSPSVAGGNIPDTFSFHHLFGEDGLDPDRDPEGFVEYLFENCTIVGDAAHCREQIAELRDRIGLDSLMTWQNFGSLSHEASMASQKRFIEEVAPAFA